MGIIIDTPSHDRAVRQLLGAIGAGNRLVWLRGEEGVGKSCVLRSACAQLDGARWRVARAAWSGDPTDVYSSLATGLADPPSRSHAEPTAALADLRRAVHLRHLEGFAVLLAVDADEPPIDRTALSVLCHLGADDAGRLVVVGVLRSTSEHPSLNENSWDVAIEVEPLTRTEAAAYLDLKRPHWGIETPPFSAAAATTLHAVARGLPSRLDRLAVLSAREATRGNRPRVERAHVEAALSALSWYAA
jgi:type II secretory pathway predicted ATPase ExeA